MRRILLAILSALATLAALAGGRYFVTAPAPAGSASTTGDTEVGLPAIEALGNGGDPDPSGTPGPSGSSTGPSGSPQPGQSTAGQSTTAGPPAGTAGTRGPTGGQPGRPGGAGQSSPPASCSSFDGNNTWIGEIGGYGTVYVTIKVCGGAVTEAKGGVMLSNYEPTNGKAIGALDQLAVKYYKTNMSMITYSGATATAAAYRTSLQTAMSQAGI